MTCAPCTSARTPSWRALREGIEKLMRTDGVRVVNGTAQVGAGGVITCAGETFEADDVTSSPPALAPTASPSPEPISRASARATTCSRAMEST